MAKSNRAWIHEHMNDPWVKQAQVDGYRSRAAYKFLEIDAKDQLLRPGMTVVDLGSAPGSWSQAVSRKLDGSGKVIALDLLPMDSLPRVTFIQGDFTEDSVLAELERALEGRSVDLVISDIAPNMSGQKTVDQARSLYLVELALDFAHQHLNPQGSLLVKVFQGSGYEEFMRVARERFVTVATRKPKASRDRSSEQYVLARQPRR